MVEAVAARCQAAGISPARRAIAAWRPASDLHRASADPSYGLVTSWKAEDAAEIDQTMAATAGPLTRQLRGPACVYPHVPCPRFARVPRALLIDERPQIRWHAQLVDLIATVMLEHGHTTPRVVTLVQRGTAGTPWARIRARWATKPRETTPPVTRREDP
jgi:hypothetical protein